MDMFNNVTSSVTTWWGKGGRKGEEMPSAADEAASKGVGVVPSADEAAMTAAAAAEEEAVVPASPAGSDKSPPTSEGADSVSIASQPDESGTGEPGADGKAQGAPGGPGFGGIAVDIEEVSSKALQSAKNIGSFFVSFGKKAGKTVTDTAKQLKHTVEENSLLGDFNKEQEAFVQEKQQQHVEAAVAPWVGYSEEEDMKQQILSLSTDRRNFLRSPPSGVSFQFDFDSMHPVAQATLAEDPNLEKMRFELVPKCINEENFWKNYFYRVSLIKQSAQLSSLAQETGSTGGDSSAKSSRKSSLDEGKVASRVETCVETATTTTSQEPNRKDVPETNSKSNSSVSVTVTKSSSSQAEEEWEKELQQELQEYEVVTDGDQPREDDAEWEQEIQKMLAAEEQSRKPK